MDVRSTFVIWLVGAAAVPMAVEGTVGTLDPQAFSEDSDLMKRAQEIAMREFSSSATLTVLEAEVVDHRIGVFGERIRPDVGFSFHKAIVRMENSGKMDMAVSTWHFSGVDEVGSDRTVQLGNAHEDFDASRLGAGRAREGALYFELRDGSHLTEIVWQGDLAETKADVPTYAHP